MFGFLNLHKPLGCTSHDCVAQIRRLAQTRRVGHGGTLDPLASGVLPLAIGQATRLLPYLPKTKSYQGVIRFGLTTTTDDLAGEILQQHPTKDLSLAQIQSHLPEFLGRILQTPPQYSAIQKGGQRLYALARAGIAVAVPSRWVDIFSLNILEWRPGEPAELAIDITCGEGTYIRSLARDWGQKVGTGATLAKLVRTLAGGMSLEQSWQLASLREQPDDLSRALIMPNEALAHLPQILLTEPESKRWFYGQRLLVEPQHPGLRVVMNKGGSCMGIGEIRPDTESRVLHPQVVLNTL